MRPVRHSDAMTAAGTMSCPRCQAKLRASALSGPRMVYLGAAVGLPVAGVVWFLGHGFHAFVIPMFTATLAAFIEIWEPV